LIAGTIKPESSPTDEIFVFVNAFLAFRIAFSSKSFPVSSTSLILKID